MLTGEMARSVSDEGGPVAAYDLKLVWSFMKNGFVSSRFKTHFPDDPTAKDDVLPSTAISKPASQPQDLDKVMASTMTMLLARPGASESIGSPTTLRDYSFSPTRVSPVTTRSPQVASSPDTVGGASVAREEETVERHPDREPWAWVNTLIAACNDIVGSMRPREEVVPTLSTGPEHARREIDGAEWALVQSPQGCRFIASPADSKCSSKPVHQAILTVSRAKHGLPSRARRFCKSGSSMIMKWWSFSNKMANGISLLFRSRFCANA